MHTPVLLLVLLASTSPYTCAEISLVITEDSIITPWLHLFPRSRHLVRYSHLPLLDSDNVRRLRTSSDIHRSCQRLGSALQKSALQKSFLESALITKAQPLQHMGLCSGLQTLRLRMSLASSCWGCCLLPQMRYDEKGYVGERHRVQAGGWTGNP